MYSLIRRLVAENRRLLVFLALLFVFRSVIADWNTVPTGSMKPTIIEGDRILVNKLAYDLRIPFTHISLYRLGEPQRGDIVVFDSSVSGIRLVKRVIGVPGDRVELRSNALFINGRPLQYETTVAGEDYLDLTENLEGIRHPVRISRFGNPRYANFGSLRIPEEKFLVLGDNRDNSSDSRMIGLVPRAEMIGRTRHVVMSLDYDNYYLPRSKRFLHTL